MKAKEKRSEKFKVKITIKNIIYFVASVIILFYCVLFYNFYFDRNKTYAKDTTSDAEDIKISNAETIDLDNIILQNSNPGYREELTQEEEELEYLTTYVTNPNIPKGISYVTQQGRKGKQKITIKKTYQDDNLISEEQVGAVMTKATLNKVVEIGGGRTTSNHKVKVGDDVYVTSDMLAVMVEPNENSTKVATLKTEDELEILEMSSNWYKIKSKDVVGWVEQDCTTYLEPDYNEEIEQNGGNEGNAQNGSQSSTGQIQKLSFDMHLNKPSGLSLEQFQKILTDDKDVNNIFKDNAEYFYYIEKQYNINGIFVAAVGIHESAWGTSKIARQKHNLFGYGAYDSNPYNGAYDFNDYSECIDLIARVFVKYYLNPKGTSIYGGETASGKYYTSPTLTGVNNKYATDKNWANSVYKIMQYLYNKI